MEKSPGLRIHTPLVVLAVLAVVAGFVEAPEFLGGKPWFSGFMETALPSPVRSPVVSGSETLFEFAAGIVALAAIGLAYMLFLRSRLFVERIAASKPGRLSARYFFVGWGFDWLYDRVLIRPFLRLCRFAKSDFIDRVYGGIAFASRLLHQALSSTETGRVRWYAAGIVFGTVVLVAIAVFL